MNNALPEMVRILTDGRAKPCPFCGALPMIYDLSNADSTYVSIVCDNPNCGIPSLFDHLDEHIADLELHVEDALNRWNSRI